MNFISDILFWISTGLLVPVIVILILLFLRSLLLAGNFFGQYMNIRKSSKVLKDKLEGLDASTVGDLGAALPKKDKSLAMRYLREILAHRESPAHVKKLLADFEIDADKDLSVSKTLTKLGPMLGLMGTLIPMGPALVGLSTGDISSMAYNMQVAFATTVVGLFSSAVGFLTQQTKNRWYMRDLTNLEFVAEVISGVDGAGSSAEVTGAAGSGAGEGARS